MITRLFLWALCGLLFSCEQNGTIRDVLETSKRSLEAAQETHEKLKGRIESIKKEKARIEREVEEENAKFGRDVDADAANAEVFITQENGHLRCRMRPIKGAFKRIEQTENTRILWFADGVQVTRRHQECGSGKAGPGFGLARGGRSCESIGGPHHRQGLYPYQVPEGTLDNARFICRLHFPKTARHLWRELLSADLDTLVAISSKPIRWPGWRSLKTQGLSP